MRTRFKVVLTVGLILGPLALPSVHSVAAFKYLQPGMTAPPVSGKDIISGEKVSIDTGAESDHQTTCVAFWASWSPRSLEMLADLKELATRLSDEPLRVIAVNVDSQVTTPEIVERVQRIVDELNPSFPVIMDKDLEFFYAYGVIAVPSMAILDAEGVVRDDPSGYSYSIRDRLDVTVETLLGLREEEEEETQVVDTGYRPAPGAARYYQLAVRLANQRHYETALARADAATEQDKLFSGPFNLRGYINLQLGDLEAAIENFERAVALDSLSVSARAGLGWALLEAKDTTAAQAQLEKALEIDRAYPAALQNLARCLVTRGDPDRALEILEEAVELNPRDPQLYYHLGRVHRLEGRMAEALTAYRVALEMVFPRP